MKEPLLQKWVDERSCCGCRCASPVPHALPDQPRARELCLDLLRLNQTQQSTSFISRAAICGVMLVLLKKHESGRRLVADALVAEAQRIG